MITRRLAYLGCILAAAGLAAGFIFRGFFAGGAILISLGLLWILGIRRRWESISPTMFLLFAIFSAILLLILAPPYLEVISLSAALISWDLDHFETRLERIRPAEMARNVETSHLVRLFTSIGAGILVSAAALLIHIQLSFAVALLSGAVALIALSQVIHRLARRQGITDPSARIRKSF